LESLGIQAKKSLFVLADANKNVYLSSRNLEQSKVVTSSELNTYSIVNAVNVILSESAIEAIETNLNK
jgi:large subunit ribosomal protein L4